MLKYAVVWFVTFVLTISVWAQAEDTLWTCPPGFEGQTLHIYNWEDYIAPEVLDVFEELCGVSIIYDEYAHDSQMLIELRRGNTPYDIVIPGLETIGLLSVERLLYPLDHEQIPNMANIISKFLDLPQDPQNRYSVPYQWGTIGVGYNAQVVDTPIVSWADFFTYGGRLGWMDRPEIMLGVALRYLGYDGGSTDEAELSEARDLLIAFGRANGIIMREGNGYEYLLDGELDMVMDYSGDVLRLNETCECEDFVYVIPEEGANLWFDMMAIPLDAPNPDLAHAFIDFVLDEHISATISNVISYATPNRVSIDEGLVQEDLLENPSIYPSLDDLDRMFFLNVPTVDLNRLYQSYWYEIILLVEAEL